MLCVRCWVARASPDKYALRTAKAEDVAILPLSLSLLSIDHVPVLPSIAFCLFCSQIWSQEARVASRGFDILAIAKFNGVTES